MPFLKEPRLRLPLPILVRLGKSPMVWPAGWTWSVNAREEAMRSGSEVGGQGSYSDQTRSPLVFTKDFEDLRFGEKLMGTNDGVAGA